MVRRVRSRPASTSVEAASATAAGRDPNTAWLLANEVYWYFGKPPTQGVKDWAVQMTDKYGVALKLKDPTGADHLVYVWDNACLTRPTHDAPRRCYCTTTRKSMTTCGAAS